MPELNVFQPTVLNGVIEKMTDATQYTWLGSIPVVNSPYPYAEWDVIRGSRHVSRLNTPNAEAHIVPRLGSEHLVHSLAYVRDKKVLEPTTLYWLRRLGEPNAVENAEKAVMRELTDLNSRVDNLQEYSIWQALQGTLVFNDAQGAATVVDYKMPASHKSVAATKWATADFKAIVADVTSQKRLIQRDGRVTAKEAYTAPGTMDMIIGAFAGNQAVMSDRMKDAYYQGDTLPGFLSLNWKTVSETYDVDDKGVVSEYLPEGKVLFGDFKTNQPIQMTYGPTADLDAPQGKTGKFTKQWVEKDPAAHTILIELHFLPVVLRPEQFSVLSIG